ncbi:P-loop containing nucleoside triphosphate hydrolase protein [Pilobolus umbonatus]|nr:P-loop containing nucleoside triphosphate hydrolase protein [Pilobolus umbonatus]
MSNWSKDQTRPHTQRNNTGEMKGSSEQRWETANQKDNSGTANAWTNYSQSHNRAWNNRNKPRNAPANNRNTNEQAPSNNRNTWSNKNQPSTNTADTKQSWSVTDTTQTENTGWGKDNRTADVSTQQPSTDSTWGQSAPWEKSKKEQTTNEGWGQTSEPSAPLANLSIQDNQPSPGNTWGQSAPWEKIKTNKQETSTSWANASKSANTNNGTEWKEEKPAAFSTEWTTVKPKDKPAEATWEGSNTAIKEDAWSSGSNTKSEGNWGAMTLKTLGWDNSKPKDTKEAGRGTWENGMHILGEENEQMRLKLFGTEDDKITIHSGINFENYDNIPVETQGDNVPEPIKEFASANLDKHLISTIKLARYKIPTPVQKYSIPIILQGHDLMACAQTGSGKTAGFLFPILSALFTKGPKPDPVQKSAKDGYRAHKKAFPQVLILAPTRELASQIYDEAKKFCYRSYVRPCVAYGGADIQQQLRLIDRGCHVLVATPGRLTDIIERRRVSFANIEYLVLDEADRMLDMGFEPQIRRIVEGEDMPPTSGRQTLLFSATFPEKIQLLARDFLKDNIFLSVGKVGATSENITQHLEYLTDNEKRPRLLQILEKTKDIEGLTLIFTETKRMADVIHEYLMDHNYSSTVIHGDRIQSEREAALDSFRKGSTPIMVATAVAARGLDISNITHVISYDLPKDIDDYVHRIGRTGRAGNTGMATAFFTDNNKYLAKDLTKLLQNAKQEVPNWLSSIATENIQAPPPMYPKRSKRGGRNDYDDGVGLRISSFRTI